MSSNTDARLRQLEADNRVLQANTDALRKLQRAVRAVYSAGYWSCDRLTDDEARDLFVRLRDAASIAAGNSPVPIGMAR